eukprot:TRINITY_DN7909_c0_g1_i2.p1 TRINITY_DN7909_c0_g1~~TRINITY_DN7909_c0_g1_i2.p1  ORF type:complete len:546 (+),score=93.16 TRINITY_DN7909_c0_g1_i2:143-1780(+)
MGDYYSAVAGLNDTYDLLRGNAAIDYRQLGLNFVLSTEKVVWHRCVAYCHLGEWELAQKDSCRLDHSTPQAHGDMDQLFAQVNDAISVRDVTIIPEILVPTEIYKPPYIPEVTMPTQRVPSPTKDVTQTCPPTELAISDAILPASIDQNTQQSHSQKLEPCEIEGYEEVSVLDQHQQIQLGEEITPPVAMSMKIIQQELKQVVNELYELCHGIEEPQQARKVKIENVRSLVCKMRSKVTESKKLHEVLNKMSRDADTDGEKLSDDISIDKEGHSGLEEHQNRDKTIIQTEILKCITGLKEFDQTFGLLTSRVEKKETLNLVSKSPLKAPPLSPPQPPPPPLESKPQYLQEINTDQTLQMETIALSEADESSTQSQLPISQSQGASSSVACDRENLSKRESRSNMSFTSTYFAQQKTGRVSQLDGKAFSIKLETKPKTPTNSRVSSDKKDTPPCFKEPSNPPPNQGHATPAQKKAINPAVQQNPTKGSTGTSAILTSSLVKAISVTSLQDSSNRSNQPQTSGGSANRSNTSSILTQSIMNSFRNLS